MAPVLTGYRFGFGSGQTQGEAAAAGNPEEYVIFGGNGSRTNESITVAPNISEIRFAGCGSGGQGTFVGSSPGTHLGGGGGGSDGTGGTASHGGGAGGGANTAGTAGTVNTGGGGGAGGHSAAGAGGGSGVVILRYSNIYNITVGAGLTSSSSTDGSDKITTITAGTGSVSFALA